ncbi:MAG: 2-hydroxyglutaryl-CoA dehydratase [Blautia sp.]|nr:2-hydroxyglutaryl-CoA dehydratase [Blautia sp.]
MYTFGIDIGSTTSKCVVMKDGTQIVGTSLLVGGIGTKSPAEAVRQALENAGVTREELAGVAATGYGRNRYEDADYHVSELSCHGLGAHHTFPGVRTIIDIGGQDAKVISLDSEGRMQNFLMNDKCAAGTGRFLDVMANILVIPVGELADYCARAKEPAQISSTCTVFAESEVISQLANGVEMEDLVAGICSSVAGRVASLAKRINIVPEVCMSGGVAQNAGVRNALSEKIGHPILFSPNAQLFGAIGAALYAWEKKQ